MKRRVGQGQPWEDWEKAFVIETYPDPKWHINDIAAKLERDPRNVYSMAARLGVKRPDTSLDHSRIAELRAEGLSLVAVAEVMGCSKGGVQRVLRIAGGEHG
ncbi:MAG: helix-turn-helix domain-containing protein [Pseudomonadota bacterium]